MIYKKNFTVNPESPYQAKWEYDYWLCTISFLKVKTASRLTLVPRTRVPMKANAGHLILITSANAQPSSQARLANKMLMSVLRSHLPARTVVCAWMKWAPIGATAQLSTRGNTVRLCTSPATHHHAFMAGPASSLETQTTSVPVCQVRKKWSYLHVGQLVMGFF